MIVRSEKAGKYYQDTVTELMEITRTLDKLLYCVTKIKPQYRIVILKKYFDKKEDWQIAEELGMKPEEIFRLSDFSRDDFLEMMTKGHTYSLAELILNN